nr:MAG TPA: hypothetical protein [Caudoviricetes sp.]
MIVILSPPFEIHLFKIITAQKKYSLLAPQKVQGQILYCGLRQGRTRLHRFHSILH